MNSISMPKILISTSTYSARVMCLDPPHTHYPSHATFIADFLLLSVDNYFKD